MRRGRCADRRAAPPESRPTSPPPYSSTAPTAKKRQRRRASPSGRCPTTRRREGGPARIRSEPAPPSTISFPPGSATEADFVNANGSVPMRRTATGSTACRAGRNADGRRSSPSGLSSSPGAAPATPVRPYCHTIAFVRGSTTITRWFQSSVAAMKPFGRRTASDGLSSRSGPLGLPNDHVTRPERVTSTILPGSVNAATRTRPFGSSCASDGYATGRADRPVEPPVRPEPVDPAADLRDEETAVAERRVAVRAREAARRVVHARTAEDAPGPASRA